MNKVISYLEIFIGTTLISIAFGSIVLSQGFLAGGVTGISKIVSSYTSIPLSILVLIFNIVLFILGYLFIGKEFVLKTFIVTFSFPLMLEFFQNHNYLTSLSSDPLLSSILAGILIGIGGGIVIRGDGSSGGFDVIGIILFKYFRIPVSFVVGVCDATVLLVQAFNQSLIHIVYGLLVIFMTSLSMKYMLSLGRGEVQFLIFSEHYEALRQELYDQVDVGLTFLKGEMGYTRKAVNVIIVVTSYNKLNQVKAVIKNVDPTAFVVVDDVKSVIGKGYTLPI